MGLWADQHFWTTLHACQESYFSNNDTNGEQAIIEGIADLLSIWFLLTSLGMWMPLKWLNAKLTNEARLSSDLFPGYLQKPRKGELAEFSIILKHKLSSLQKLSYFKAKPNGR